MNVITGISRTTINKLFGRVRDRVAEKCEKKCSISKIIPIIEKKANKQSTMYTDRFKTYDGLVDGGYTKHFLIKHGRNEATKGRGHIKEIENFWSL